MSLDIPQDLLLVGETKLGNLGYRAEILSMLISVVDFKAFDILVACFLLFGFFVGMDRRNFLYWGYFNGLEHFAAA